MRNLKEKTKRIIASILVAALFLSIAPLSGFAKDNDALYDYLSYKIENKTITITDCDKSISGSITIPSMIDGFEVTSIGENAFENCENLTTVIIPNSVTTIESGAFWGCIKLENIELSDNIKTIWKGSFANTAYYNNPDNWENNVLYIGEYLIGTISDSNGKGLLSGEYQIKTGTKVIAAFAFDNCIELTSVLIPDSVISICSYAFEGCTGLTRINFFQTFLHICKTDSGG